MKTILSIKNLSIAFRKHDTRFHVVRNIFLDVYVGEKIAIVGESGSGKSVLAKSITALNPPHTTQIITSGNIFYDDMDLLSLNEKNMQSVRGKKIFTLLQNSTSSLNPTMKIGDQIAESFLISNTKLHSKAIKTMVIEILENVDIHNAPQLYHHYPHQLSSGMQQRVLIAMAFALKPRILILDESTKSLDFTIQNKIVSLLEKLRELANTTIIFITHDLTLAASFCDRMAVMYGGHMMEVASTKTIFSNPMHPYTKKLIKSIPTINLKRKTKLTQIEGTSPMLEQQIRGCAFWPRCQCATEICQKTAPMTQSDGSRCISCWKHNL